MISRDCDNHAGPGPGSVLVRTGEEPEDRARRGQGDRDHAHRDRGVDLAEQHAGGAGVTWNVTPVLPADVAGVWPVVEPLLAPALDVTSGRITMESVFIRLQTGVYLLWVAHEDDLARARGIEERRNEMPRLLILDCRDL